MIQKSGSLMHQGCNNEMDIDLRFKARDNGPKMVFINGEYASR